MSSAKQLNIDAGSLGGVDPSITPENVRVNESPRKATAAGHRSRPGFPHRVQTDADPSLDDGISEISTEFDVAGAVDEFRLNDPSPVPSYDENANDTSGEASANPETESMVSDKDDNHSTHTNAIDDDEAVDETDRLLDQMQLNHTENESELRRGSLSRVRTLSGTPLAIPQHYSAAILRHGVGTALSANAITYTDDDHVEENPSSTSEVTVVQRRTEDAGRRRSGELRSDSYRVRKNVQWDPELLIEGVLFRANYLGSTQLTCDGRPTKTSRMVQAEEAVSRIKAPAGENQPSTPVDLCISTEKIMVLNTGTKDAIMDPSLRSISYIADIGDLVVLMARRGDTPDASASPTSGELSITPAKIVCHVFDSPEATIIAQSIGQAFQVAYAEFLRVNGLTDDSSVREVDYQQVLNSQQIYGNELDAFTSKDAHKEIDVEKSPGEILGLVLVESGWGSLIPTVVVANMLSTGAAARSGLLNIGDQLIAVNGLSLVGLPLATSQNFIGSMAKGKRSVRLTVVPCTPVVEVQIRRPDTKFQLGFSVQNGIICSLLRGGIAERGGVRVGHRIIEINDQSVVAVRHEQIVGLLASSVGEIRMKTMPTAMFRLLTGQESPTYI